MKGPIKYYGGKTLMTDQLLAQFPDSYAVYIEAFGGGGSLLFAKPQTGSEIYNDLGENVYSLFKVLSDDSLFAELRRRLDLSYYSAQLREEYKERLDTDKSLSLLDRAYMFFYVSRSSFNSVGGFSVTYRQTIRNMARSTADFLGTIDRLPEIHQRLSSVIIEHKDALELLEKYNAPDVFMYLDPPYVKKTRKSNQTYECELSDFDHERLVDLCLNFKGKILLSGYDNPIYDRLLPTFEKVELSDPNNPNAREFVWRNYSLNTKTTSTKTETSKDSQTVDILQYFIFE